MPHLPQHITLTGIDARTDFDRVESLSARYPIEWGILYSPTRQGQQPRYPSTEVIARFVWLSRVTPAPMRVAVHLCGGAARDVLASARTGLLSGAPRGWVQRYQINTSEKEPSIRAVEGFVLDRGARGILQCRGETFPDSYDVDWLYDRSGGRGQLPESWPRPGRSGQFVGYAGGIGPDTIDGVMSDLSGLVTERNRYWLDMESAIRTEDWIDLDKCESVLHAVYGDK